MILIGTILKDVIPQRQKQTSFPGIFALFLQNARAFIINDVCLGNRSWERYRAERGSLFKLRQGIQGTPAHETVIGMIVNNVNSPFFPKPIIKSSGALLNFVSVLGCSLRHDDFTAPLIFCDHFNQLLRYHPEDRQSIETEISQYFRAVISPARSAF